MPKHLASSAQPPPGKRITCPDDTSIGTSLKKKLCPTDDAVPDDFDCYHVPDARTRVESCFKFTHEEESNNRLPAKIGIALAGGGSRAAPYAMGTLQALWESGILAQANYISSVSGSSYAAYFLYSHLMANTAGAQPPAGNPADWFRDCIPYKYAGLVYPTDAQNADNFGQYVCSRRIDSVPSQRIYDEDDPFKYQNFIRGNQDIFSKPCFYRETTKGKPWHTFAMLGLETVAQAGPYALANTLFDERLPLSISGNAYRNGIAKTYGSVPRVLNLLHDKALCRGAADATRLQDYTFEDLRQMLDEPSAVLCPTGKGAACARQKRKIPSWIIDTTASSSGRVFDEWNGPSDLPADRREGIDVPQINLRYSVFELSAYGLGSDQYGYLQIQRPGQMPAQPVPISILRATAASGGFADPQERTWKSRTRTAAGGAMYVFGAVWGDDIGNYDYSDADFDRARSVHSLLPYPIYLGHDYRRDGNSLYIHLSDGGQSDNTGIFSLLRRGVTTIIFADAGQDQFGTFGDLCLLRDHLERGDLYHIRLNIVFDDGYPFGESFKLFCKSHTTANQPIFDMQRWPYPVMHARIQPIDDTGADKEKFMVDLFVLKPSLDLRGPVNSGSTVSLGQFVHACQSAGKQTNAIGCGELARRVGCNARGYNGVPCEVIGYLAYQPPSAKCTPIHYPQDSTVLITAHSSFTMYGAYRELAHFAAGQLTLSPDGDIHFEDALRSHLAPVKCVKDEG